MKTRQPYVKANDGSAIKCCLVPYKEFSAHSRASIVYIDYKNQVKIKPIFDFGYTGIREVITGFIDLRNIFI